MIPDSVRMKINAYEEKILAQFASGSGIFLHGLSCSSVRQASLGLCAWLGCCATEAVTDAGAVVGAVVDAVVGADVAWKPARPNTLGLNPVCSKPISVTIAKTSASIKPANIRSGLHLRVMAKSHTSRTIRMPKKWNALRCKIEAKTSIMYDK